MFVCELVRLHVGAHLDDQIVHLGTPLIGGSRDRGRVGAARIGGTGATSGMNVAHATASARLELTRASAATRVWRV